MKNVHFKIPIDFKQDILQTYYWCISSRIQSKVDTYLLCLNQIPVFLIMAWIENGRNTCTEPTHGMNCRISSPVECFQYLIVFTESLIML